jgi:hypothetical protein
MNTVVATPANPLRVLAWFAWAFAAWAALGVAAWFVPFGVGSSAETILGFGAPLGGVVGSGFAVLFIALAARQKPAIIQGLVALAINVGAAAWFWFWWFKD